MYLLLSCDIVRSRYRRRPWGAPATRATSSTENRTARRRPTASTERTDRPSRRMSLRSTPPRAGSASTAREIVKAPSLDWTLARQRAYGATPNSSPLFQAITSRSVDVLGDRVVANIATASRRLVLPLAFDPKSRSPAGSRSRWRLRYERNSSRSSEVSLIDSRGDARAGSRRGERMIQPVRRLAGADHHRHDHVRVGVIARKADNPRL